jgi:hypothetical protein
MTSQAAAPPAPGQGLAATGLHKKEGRSVLLHMAQLIIVFTLSSRFSGSKGRSTALSKLLRFDDKQVSCFTQMA